MENSFDNAHFAFVHKGTFGRHQPAQTRKVRKSLRPTTDLTPKRSSLIQKSAERGQDHRELTDPTTKNDISATNGSCPSAGASIWNIHRASGTSFSGLRNAGVRRPRIQVVQILFRNDAEADCSTQELIDWDAVIIAEDRDMLESTDPDAIVDMSRKIEKHMPSDRPGMIMRKRLLELLHGHDEKEQPRQEGA